MTANKPAAERLARALVAAGVPFDAETGAGCTAIGVALLRAHGLSLADVDALVRLYYDAAPDCARHALEPDDDAS